MTFPSPFRVPSAVALCAALFLPDLPAQPNEGYRLTRAFLSSSTTHSTYESINDRGQLAGSSLLFSPVETNGLAAGVTRLNHPEGFVDWTHVLDDGLLLGRLSYSPPLDGNLVRPQVFWQNGTFATRSDLFVGAASSNGWLAVSPHSNAFWISDSLTSQLSRSFPVSGLANAEPLRPLRMFGQSAPTAIPPLPEWDFGYARTRFTWPEGDFEEYDRFRDGWAIAINNAGDAVVFVQTMETDTQASVWDSPNSTFRSTYIHRGGEAIALPRVERDGWPARLMATDINDVGEVVGYTDSFPGIRWFWYMPPGGVPQEILTLPRDGISPYRFDPRINNDGMVFFDARPWPQENSRIWHRGRLIDLNDLLPAGTTITEAYVGTSLRPVTNLNPMLSVQPGPVRIRHVLGINNRNQILALAEMGGYGFDVVLSPANPISLHIEPDRTFRPNEHFEAEISVRLTGDLPMEVRFPADFLMADEAGVLDIPDLPEIEPFTLTPEDPVRTFAVRVRTAERGITNLFAVVETTEAGLAPETHFATREVIVSPLEITITSTPRQLTLNLTPEDERDPLCEDEGANCIVIRAVVRNASNRTVSNVTIPGATEVLSLISSRTDDPGVPLTQIRLIPPAGTPENPQPVSLGRGESLTYTWLVNAFEAPADLRVRTLVLAGLDGQPLQTLADGRVEILDEVLLHWGMRPFQGRTDYISGQTPRVDGFIENVTEEAGEGRELLVMVYPMSEGNLGGGFVGEAAEFEGRPTPDDYEFFFLPPEGDERRVDLRAIFRSFPTVDPSQGVARYGVRVWVVEEDGSLTNTVGRAKLEDGWLDEFTIRFQANPPIPDFFREDCRARGHSSLYCGFLQGVSMEAVDGALALYQFAADGASSMAELGRIFYAQNIWLYKLLWRTIQGDPAVYQDFMQEMYVNYLTVANLGVMAKQAVDAAPMVFEAFAISAADSISNFFSAVERGDLQEVSFLTGQFFGANPDLLLEPLVMARAFLIKQRALRSMASEISDNAIAAAARQQRARQQTDLNTRLRDATRDPNRPNLATALRAGDELDDSLLLRIFGISAEQRQALQEIARQFDVILTFRSRNPRSVELLRTNQAWPKVQNLKWKGVNRIDIDFLGYPDNTFGRLHILEPPPGLIGKLDSRTPPSRELSEALDLYMDGLRARYPELKANPGLAGEVKARLRQRTEEFNKLAGDHNLGSQASSSRIDVQFDADLQFTDAVGKKVGMNDTRTVTTTPQGAIADPVTGQTRRQWELKMTGPDGGEARWVTGDVDFLALLDPNGGLIQDPKKRIQLYRALAAKMDMQHGESFSFFLQKPREEFLRCCVEGGEALVSIGPHGRQTPTAGFFVDNLSILERGPNAALLGARRALRNNQGEVVLKEGSPILIRRADPTGEFVLINGMPVTTNLRRDFINRFFPRTYAEALEGFRKRFPFYFPTYVERLLRDRSEGETSGGERGIAQMSGHEPPPAVFTLSGWIVQPRPDPATPDGLGLARWTPAHGWQPVSAAQILAHGTPDVPEFAPMTSLFTTVEVGTREIELTPQDILGTAGDFFVAGDAIVLNPGELTEEYARITQLHPLRLDRPLRFGHEMGTLVAWVPDVPDMPTYAAWATAEGLDGSNNHITHDASGDGWSNLAAFALGLPARTPVATSPLRVVRPPEDNVRLQFFAPRQLTGVRVSTEFTTDPAREAWTPGPDPRPVDQLGDFLLFEVPLSGQNNFTRLIFAPEN